MIYSENELIIDDEIIDFYDNEWIRDNSEILGSETYNVYQGTGDSSLVKLLIKEEIVVDL